MKEKHLQTVLFYGTSMNPTLRHPDMLYVVPFDDREIRPGDVIVFRLGEGDRLITHRVISVDSGGIRTRGDNCAAVDSGFLTADDIVGRVVRVQRGKKVRPIHGGFTGRCVALKARTVRECEKRLCALLRPLYHFLARSGIFRKLFPSQAKPRILCIHRGEGVEMQALLGNRVVARKLSGHSHWSIMRPFRLFLDESTLP